jgi:hypothetical protein
LYLKIDKINTDENVSDVEAVKRFMDGVMENATERASHSFGLFSFIGKKNTKIVIKETDIEL